MIQVACYSSYNSAFKSNTQIEVNNLGNVRSLDDFDINVIDLSDSCLWKRTKMNDSIDEISHFHTISDMLKRSKNKKNLIILPQNIIFEDFKTRIKLKDMLPRLSDDILKCLYSKFAYISIKYENTRVNINGVEYSADFCFFEDVRGKSVVNSDQSNKILMIKMEDVYITTLKIENVKSLLNVLKHIDFLKVQEDMPGWVLEYSFYTDKKRKLEIEECNNEIEQLKAKISIAQNELEQNLRFKSIIYYNGEKLVEMIFEALTELLGVDLSDFVDEKNEDFNFRLGEMHYIGEIKGVSKNVRGENISQLDGHCENYLDSHKEVEEKKVKGLLIMNHQRNKKLEDRIAIEERLIKKAENHNILIIETRTILELLNDYRLKKINREDIEIILASQKGLLIYNSPVNDNHIKEGEGYGQNY